MRSLDPLADLPHLIWLGSAALRLQVEDLFDVALCEDVVVTPDAFVETEPLEQTAQGCKRDGCVRAGGCGERSWDADTCGGG